MIIEEHTNIRSSSSRRHCSPSNFSRVHYRMDSGMNMDRGGYIQIRFTELAITFFLLLLLLFIGTLHNVFPVPLVVLKIMTL